MIRLLTLPFRLAAAAVTAAVVLPVTLSLKLLRVSLVASLRATRLAIRSSLVTFALGIGAGWFLSTPRGRQLVESVRSRVAGGGAGGPGGAAPTGAPAGETGDADAVPAAPAPAPDLTPHPDEDGELPPTSPDATV